MTIEILRRKSLYQFRLNLYNMRVIEYRLNKHGGRWKHYQTFATEEEARTEILKIERERK